MAGQVRIGCSGWSYPHWRGGFYPVDARPAEFLERYSAVLPSVELNNPFYRQPEKKTFEKWRRSVPDDFIYAVKLRPFTPALDASVRT